MKRIVYFVLILILVVTTTTPCHAKKHVKHTHVRYANGTVCSYNENTRSLYIRTDDGNVWEVKTDCPQFGCVRVKFDTMKTRKVEDDRIIKISLIK